MNYQTQLEEILKNMKNKPKLLLHSCCAPCSSYVITYLKDYFDITVLYYNPNIAPQEEYEKRKAEQKRLISSFPFVSFLDCDYDNELYEEKVKDLQKEKEGGKRCHVCFTLRLFKTAQIAKEKEFDYFGTTLTVSPHKNAQVINDIGQKISQEWMIPFLVSDFKKKDGYKKSIELSKKYQLYRQNYCGCLYSKRGEKNENI